MRSDGLGGYDYDLNIGGYLDEAEMVANMVIEQCHEEGRSYFCLHINGEGAKFAPYFEAMEDPGGITVFRSEAPVRGSTCTVKFPHYTG